MRSIVSVGGKLSEEQRTGAESTSPGPLESNHVSGKFEDLIDAPEGSYSVLLGNAAFALGAIHAGFHAAEGYPGTPSSEVVGTLLTVPERIDAGWSVNEAVAVGVALGRSLAGEDVVVTMKTPGLFQAADVVSSAAFYNVGPGAMVLYVATDYEPSSTQNIIDARYFLSSCSIPIFEPCDHQNLYDVPRRAARLSRELGIPVAVLCGGILAHSEGIVAFGKNQKRRRKSTDGLRSSVLLPSMARARYDQLVTEVIPKIEQRFSEEERWVAKGDADFGIISVGAAAMATKEALTVVAAQPHLMTLSVSSPLPIEAIAAFADDCSGRLVVFEEGGRFVEERLRLMGLNVVGKETKPTITYWQPDWILELLSKKKLIRHTPTMKKSLPFEAVSRPPSICPGCPYRGVTLIIQKLKKKRQLDTVFGDIGCSTLMLFLGALDLNLCMGASETIRQGYVCARPEEAGRSVSLIGDSGECHTGLDASRNAIFREIPGVKIILDNRAVAMTGGQETPTTSGRLDLAQALGGEGVEVRAVDAYDLAEIESGLKDALAKAEQGVFSAIVIKGECLQSRPSASKRRTLYIDKSKCSRCLRCAVCPGIAIDDDGFPMFTILCRNCGGNPNICKQRCTQQAIVTLENQNVAPKKRAAQERLTSIVAPNRTDRQGRLPKSIRLAVRGIGGQGNLFFGKVLAKVFLNYIGPGQSIVKGETHGMAQLGGPVISTFAWGEVNSPNFLTGEADVLVSMEMSEILRSGFISLLKPGGRLICNRFSAIPAGVSPDAYPKLSEIRSALSDYNVLEFDAISMAKAAGDITGRSANVAAIGLLSTIPPFSTVPTDTWLVALDELSKTAAAAKQNRLTFEYSVAATTNKADDGLPGKIDE